MLKSYNLLLGPYSRTIARVLVGSKGDGRSLMGEVPLYQTHSMSTEE